MPSICSPRWAIFNNRYLVFIASCSSYSFSHLLLSVILRALRCCCFSVASEFLILSRLEPNLDLKIYPASGFTGMKINTANAINSIIFSVKSPVWIPDQWKKIRSVYLVCDHLSQPANPKAWASLFIVRTIKDETKRRHLVLLHDSLHSSKMAALTFFWRHSHVTEHTLLDNRVVL